MNERHARDARETAALGEKLQVLPQVRALDSADEPGGWQLAYALTEIDDSLSRIRDLVTRIRTSEEGNAEAVQSRLIEIGVELRHIMQHVKDSKFYDYLAPPE